MNYIFFGTPEFAAIIIEKLIKSGFIPQAIVCNPDKPAGRKKIITAPPVKQRILNLESEIKNKIKIIQPEKLDENFRNSLFKIQDYGFDIFIVAAYAKIIPKEILNIPLLGTIGVHPSLLPKYRGSSPVQTAILNGEKETGVTLFLVDEKVDHGPVLAVDHLSFFDDDCETLTKKLANLGADLLINSLTKFIGGKISPKSQNEKLAIYTKKFKTEDAFVEFADLKKAMENGGETAAIIERKIRAFNPEPGVFTITKKNGQSQRIKIINSALKEKKLVLTKIQPEGKKFLDDLNAIKKYVE